MITERKHRELLTAGPYILLINGPFYGQPCSFALQLNLSCMRGNFVFSAVSKKQNTPRFSPFKDIVVHRGSPLKRDQYFFNHP